jgi:pimeloyl-ACP methyl ester carboxylesterase
VITEAGDDEKVKALVYVAAFAPTAGSLLSELLRDAPPPAWAKKIIVDKAGFFTLLPDAIAQEFAQDLPQAEKAFLAATQGPIAARCFDDKLTAAAWTEKPSWYVIATQDHMINPSLQHAWAKRMKAHTTELVTSHVPMLSKPKEVAAATIDAATSGAAEARKTA